MVLYKWSQTRSTSCTNLIFPLNNFYESVPIQIQNNMHCWWIEIKKSPKFKLKDNIGDLSKTTFWYHRNDTKRNPWVMLCSHCPITCDILVRILMRVLQRAGWRLKWADWRWMELAGAGWRWVHGLIMPFWKYCSS